MKITYHRFNAVGSWRWDLKPSTPASATTTRSQQNAEVGSSASSSDGEMNDDDDDDEDEEDDDDEVCGICQLEFESSCPGCKVPGDDCPLMWGQCTHVFHMHCLLKWLNTESSKEQCPLDRRPWVTAERHTDQAHGAPLPVAVPLLGTTPTGTGTGPRRPGRSRVDEEDEVEDEEEDRSMMTIGEESDGRGHEPVRGAAGGGEGGGRMRTMEAEEGDEEEEDDDVELRMAIEASRAALGM